MFQERDVQASLGRQQPHSHKQWNMSGSTADEIQAFVFCNRQLAQEAKLTKFNWKKNKQKKKPQQGKSNTCQCALSLSLKIARLHLPPPKPLFVASWLWAGTVGGFKGGQRLPDACLCLHQADNAANRLVYIYSAHFDKASFLPFKRSCKLEFQCC